MKHKNIQLPLSKEVAKELVKGDIVYLSGYIYTGRDAAHKKLVEDIENGQQPIDLKDETIYYVGPCPAPDNHVIGAAGPTTSSRMDEFTIQLLEAGLRGMIGKGPRADHVVEGIKKHQGIYFVACGGAASLLAKCITEVTEVAYKELGTESIKRLKIENFPVVVAIDTKGESMFA